MTCLGDQLGMEVSPEKIAAAFNRKGLVTMDSDLLCWLITEPKEAE